MDLKTKFGMTQDGESEVCFKCIRWNFPHPGAQKGMREGDPRMKQQHEDLMSGFFSSCAQVQHPGGRIKLVIIRYPPVSRETIATLASTYGYNMKETKVFDPKKYPAYVRVWGDARDDNAYIHDPTYDDKGQRLFFEKRDPTQSMPRAHKPMLFCACLNYYLVDDRSTAQQQYAFIKQSFEQHVADLSHIVHVRTGAQLACLGLTFLPKDIHPRKQAFVVADALIKDIFKDKVGVKKDLTHVTFGTWKHAACVEVATPTEKLCLIHLLAEHESKVINPNNPKEWCQFKSALIFFLNPSVYQAVKDAHCNMMGFKIGGRTCCVLDLSKDGRPVEICPDSMWLPWVGRMILQEAFVRLKHGAEEVRVADLQRDVGVCTRHGVPFLLPLHSPAHIRGIAEKSELVTVLQDGLVQLTAYGQAASPEVGDAHFYDAEAALVAEFWSPCPSQR
uniref:25S rRNA (uridine-N(3))-methyltransferase BMT5-like domain-containing protein n=1 Tax=Eutreptiella gymnastica TaxID=73025 RepID=A0A7S1I2I9_9EUGL